jgi:hypothetical protein
MRAKAAPISAVLIALVGAVGACGHDALPSNGPSGMIHGGIVMTGGPRGASPVAGAGTVLVTHDGDEVARQKVADGGEFSFGLAPGKYRVTVAGVDGACDKPSVTVVANADRAVSVTCQRK